MWVVLRFENEYDQKGGYFVGVFDCEGDCVSPNGHFGRVNAEDTWYIAKSVLVDEIYGEDHPIHTECGSCG